ncbi:MAG: hypothetical protein ABI642_02040 [Polaromonas sp.]
MKQLVRTSAGHAQVLRDQALAPFPDPERDVVPSHALTADLAMVSGWLAGTYRTAQKRPDRQTTFLASNKPIAQTKYAQAAINSVVKILYFLYSFIASQTDCVLGVAATMPHRTQREFLALLATTHVGIIAMPSTSSFSSTALESDTP